MYYGKCYQVQRKKKGGGRRPSKLGHKNIVNPVKVELSIT